MAFAVVLFFDAATDATIRRIGQGLASTELFEGDLRPHISLGVCDTLNPAGFEADFMAFAAATPARDFTLASLGLFLSGEEAVVFLAPVVTDELLAMHAAFHGVFASYAVSQQGYYLPGNWVPHCTLVLGLPRDRVAAVVDSVARAASLPVTGRFESIGLIRFMPATDVYTARLA